MLLGRWLHTVGSCQCSCYVLLRRSHRALSCASEIIFHKWIVCKEHLLPSSYNDWKKMELCQFSVKFRERPEYFEWLFTPFHSFEVWVLFVFLLWENFCSLLQSFLLWHLCQGCEPELTRQARSLYAGVSEGCSPFHSACRQVTVLGLESDIGDFAPRQGQQRGKSLLGMLLWLCVCVPHISGCIHAHAGNVQGHGARRWHSRSSNVSRTLLIPSIPPKGARAAGRAGADTPGQAESSWSAQA